jgi:hypothetical protein
MNGNLETKYLFGSKFFLGFSVENYSYEERLPEYDRRLSSSLSLSLLRIKLGKEVETIRGASKTLMIRSTI